MDRENPSRQTAARTRRDCEVYPPCLHEEVADEQPHKELRNPLRSVNQARNLFDFLLDLRKSAPRFFALSIFPLIIHFETASTAKHYATDCSRSIRLLRAWRARCTRILIAF